MIQLPITRLMSAPKALRYAYQFAAEYSDDPHTQVGAVVTDWRGNIITRGANRFPSGVEIQPERLVRPTKYFYMEHAERDALRGLSYGQGDTMFAPWSACADCARAIINAGIRRVVAHKQILIQTPERWMDSILAAKAMFTEAGVDYEWFDGPVNVEMLFNEEKWCA